MSQPTREQILDAIEDADEDDLIWFVDRSAIAERIRRPEELGGLSTEDREWLAERLIATQTRIIRTVLRLQDPPPG